MLGRPLGRRQNQLCSPRTDDLLLISRRLPTNTEKISLISHQFEVNVTLRQGNALHCLEQLRSTKTSCHTFVSLDSIRQLADHNALHDRPLNPETKSPNAWPNSVVTKYLIPAFRQQIPCIDRVQILLMLCARSNYVYGRTCTRTHKRTFVPALLGWSSEAAASLSMIT